MIKNELSLIQPIQIMPDFPYCSFSVLGSISESHIVLVITSFFFFFWSFSGGSVFLMALTFWKILASYSVESPLIWFVCCLLMISLRLYIFDKTMTIVMCLSLYITSENTLWTRFITADKILPLVKVMWWGSSTVKLLLFFIYFIFKNSFILIGG